MCVDQMVRCVVQAPAIAIISVPIGQGRRQVQKCGVDTYLERVKREPIMGSEVEPPAASRSRAPGQGLGGKAP